MKQDTNIKEQCSNLLKGMASELSGKDKAFAAAKCKISSKTVYNYLAGEIGDVEIALTLIEVFSKKIMANKARLKTAVKAIA